MASVLAETDDEPEEEPPERPQAPNMPQEGVTQPRAPSQGAAFAYPCLALSLSDQQLPDGAGPQAGLPHHVEGPHWLR